MPKYDETKHLILLIDFVAAPQEQQLSGRHFLQSREKCGDADFSHFQHLQSESAVSVATRPASTSSRPETKARKNLKTFSIQ